MSKERPMPGKRAIASVIAGIRKDIRPEFQDEEGNVGIDVRLQVLQTSTPPFFEWRIWTGDSSYDTDHTGFWGNAFIQKDSSCSELAKDLIDQAADHAAQCE